MKPVYQTLFGRKNGNCHAACIASIFEIPLEGVPNFCCEPTWPLNENEWLRERGFVRIQFDIDAETFKVWQPLLTGAFRDVYHLAGVDSPRGPWLHLVVFQNGKLIHDPHPEGGSENAIPVDISFFIPIDPARMLRADSIATEIGNMIRATLAAEVEK